MTNGQTIRIRRVYDPVTPEDGLRILVDRLWPRGLSREAAKIDIWCKQVAPSGALRSWYGHRQDRFGEFAHRYEHELLDDPNSQHAFDQLKHLATGNTITLLTASRALEISDAAVVMELLSRPTEAPVPGS